MEGIPVHPLERRRTGVAVPPAPPPLRSVRSRTLDSSHSAIAKRGGRSIARAVEESAEPGMKMRGPE